MPDERTKPKELLFSGKLRTDDPAAVGTNFQTLKNMRYTDTHIRGIQGMTLLGGMASTEQDAWDDSDTWGNSDAWGLSGTFYNTRNAFHFQKSQPPETHIITQKFNSIGSESALLQNVTEIPQTGSFADSVLMTSAGNQRSYFSNAPGGKVVICNGIDTHIWGGNESSIGAFITTTAETTAATLTNAVDCSQIINNIKTDAENLVVVGGTVLFILIGTSLPIQGWKAYVNTANASAGIMTGKYWDGNSWETLTLTDNTSVGGKTLAKTGTITFASTVVTAKPQYLSDQFLYWYQFALSACDDIRISYATIDAPIQNIVDLWDGVYRSPVKFYKRTTDYLDNTTNVLEEEYFDTDTTTYADISSLGAFSEPDNCLEIGFIEPQTAILFNIPPGYNNGTASTAAAVDFWNGSAYTTVGTIVDGTVAGGASMVKTGVISWNANGYTTETRKVVANSKSLYFYRVRFDKAMDASVRVDYVGGITKQKIISYYKFPIEVQGRVLLCADMSQDRHKAICSAKDMSQVYNGEDSVDIYFGTDGELSCGTELFSQFGASLYSLVLILKDNELWLMAGTDIAEWASNTFLLSSTIGCPAPLTLKTINLNAEPGAGTNRSLAIWQGANGVYMSDGRAPIPIHGDIKAYFDQTDGRCINQTKIRDSVGFIDPVNQEYHWLFASGESTSLNKELVYDIARNKWFEVDRANPLQFGLLVHDLPGNSYTYGFLDNGKMYRLEYGTDFSGTDIIQEVQFGDIALAGLATETQVDRMRLITKSKTTTTNDVTLTHYGDGAATGTAFTLTPQRNGYRIAQPIITDKLMGDPFHSFKLQITTNDEVIGFEPLALVVTHHATHRD